MSNYTSQIILLEGKTAGKTLMYAGGRMKKKFLSHKLKFKRSKFHVCKNAESFEEQVSFSSESESDEDGPPVI